VPLASKISVIPTPQSSKSDIYNNLEGSFDGWEASHISRSSNEETDMLANIGSKCLQIPPGVFWEETKERSTKEKKPAEVEKSKGEKAKGKKNSGLGGYGRTR
jgi:hypothetical protein